MTNTPTEKVENLPRRGTLEDDPHHPTEKVATAKVEAIVEEWDELIKVSTKLELRNWLRSTLTQTIEECEARKGIKQGTLYGYDLMLMAPEEDRNNIINENTLESYIKNLVDSTKNLNLTSEVSE